MKILFAARHTCIRAIKIGIALADAGHDVGWIHGMMRADLLPEIGPNYFATDYSDFAEKVAKLAPEYDIVHAHTQPTEPVAIAKHAAGDTPVIYDVHDLERTLSGHFSDAEKAAFALCDGAMFVSYETANIVRSEIPRVNDIPVMVLYSKVPRRLVPSTAEPPWLDGMVFQGMLSDVFNQQLPEMAGVFRKFEIPFYVYTSTNANQRILDQMAANGAVASRQLSYRALIRVLGRHTAAYVGTPDPDTLRFKTAMPNKLFDALAAGIPVIAHNAPAVMSYLEAFGCGSTIQDLGEIKEHYGIWRQRMFHEDYRPHEATYLMDPEVPRIIEFYRKAIANVSSESVRIAV